MCIGTTGGGTAPAVTEAIANSQRYFIDFLSYLTAAVGIAHTVHSAHGASSKYSITDTARFSSKQDGGEWHWAPAYAVSDLSSNFLPNAIHLQRFDVDQPESDAHLNLGAMGALLATFAQALATNYFERHRSIIASRFGPVKNWPPVWNFARVVRNAMAHGGKVSILNANDPPGRWKGAHYTINDNGRDILALDLWPGDLFDLIIEMDSYLHADGVFCR